MNYRETKHFGSIASKPGSFGVEFHNRGYQELGLNCHYQALQVKPEQLFVAMGILRNNFQGWGVSMPHKLAVLAYLSSSDQSVEKTGAVNTVLKQPDGSLKGFNTDYMGAKKAIQESSDIRHKPVMMIGAGGAARAIALAVTELGGDLFIGNRTEEKARDLAERFSANFFDLSNSDYQGYLLVNATSVGMANPDESPVSRDILEGFDAVMDVVVTRGLETKLVRDARELGKPVIKGLTMTTHQAAEQFRLYTGRELPRSFLDNFMEYWQCSK